MRPLLRSAATSSFVVSIALLGAGCRGGSAGNEVGSGVTTGAAADTKTPSNWVKIAKGSGGVAPLLKAEIAKAEAAGKKPVVYLGASWCPPCKAIKQYRTDSRMAKAFEGAFIIELDIDNWPEAELKALGYRTGVVPMFIAVDKDAKSTGKAIDGGAWGDNIPENMAPPLTRFFTSI